MLEEYHPEKRADVSSQDGVQGAEVLPIPNSQEKCIAGAKGRAMQVVDGCRE